jgi:hypothetical protein
MPVQSPSRQRTSTILSTWSPVFKSYLEIAASQRRVVQVAVRGSWAYKVSSPASTRLSLSLPRRRRRKSRACKTQVGFGGMGVAVVNLLSYRVTVRVSGCRRSRTSLRGPRNWRPWFLVQGALQQDKAYAKLLPFPRTGSNQIDDAV